MSQVMFLTCAHVEKTKTIGSTSKIERKQKEVEYILASAPFIFWDLGTPAAPGLQSLQHLT